MLEGCKECGMVYSMVFGVQFHKVDCALGKKEARERAVMTQVVYAPSVPKRKAHDCGEHAVPYQSDGALGHGWECGICGKFLQAG